MQEPFNIEFKELFFTILRKWYITVVMILVMGGALAYIKGGEITTYYETKTRIIVGNSIDGEGKSFNIQDIQVYQNYMSTYIAMLKTDMVLDKVVEKLDFEVSAGALRGSVSASPQESTQFLDLRLTWDNKEQASKILQVLTDTFIEEMNIIYPAITLRMMDKVSEPSMRTSGTPRSKMAIVGGVLGGIASILVIFGLEFLDNTVKTERDIEHYIKSYCLTRVPKQRKKIKSINFRNVKEFTPSFVESYRLLRTNLNFLSIDQHITSIVVTSSKQGEGKSTTTSMLAVVMALAGKKTILIDCDLRKRSISKLFSLSSERGLTDVLLGVIELEEAIRKSNIDNLYILPAGTVPINPSEILCSHKAKDLIAYLKLEYQYMIIDSPPVGIITDGQVLSQYVDGCLLVSSYRRTKVQELLKAKTLIEYVDGKVLGVVMNRTKDKYINKAYKNYAKKKDEGKKGAFTKKKLDKEQIEQEKDRQAQVVELIEEEPRKIEERNEIVEEIQDEVEVHDTDGEHLPA